MAENKISRKKDNRPTAQTDSITITSVSPIKLSMYFDRTCKEGNTLT